MSALMSGWQAASHVGDAVPPWIMPSMPKLAEPKAPANGEVQR